MTRTKTWTMIRPRLAPGVEQELRSGLWPRLSQNRDQDFDNFFCQNKFKVIKEHLIELIALYTLESVWFVMMGYFGPFIECWYKSIQFKGTLQVPEWYV